MRDNTKFSLAVTPARLIMISFIMLIMLMVMSQTLMCAMINSVDFIGLRSNIYINILGSLSGHKPGINYHEPSLCWISLQPRLLWAAVFYQNSGGGSINGGHYEPNDSLRTPA